MLEAGGASAAAARFDHRESCGMIDGARHKVVGRNTSDRVRSVINVDKEKMQRAVVAREGLQPQKWTPDVTAVKAACDGFTHVQPREGWEVGEGDGLMDFMTTLRTGMMHVPFATQPTKDPDVFFERGTLVDAPYMTAHHRLRFTCTNPQVFHISSLPHEFIQRHEGGTFFWDGDVPVGARAPEALPQHACTEVVRCFYTLLKVRTFRSRGGKCASVAVNFAVTGLQCGRMTRQALPYSVTSKGEFRKRAPEKDALRAQEVSMQLRAVYRKFVRPIVDRYFSHLFTDLRAWQQVWDIHHHPPHHPPHHPRCGTFGFLRT